MNQTLEFKLSQLPESPGVYQMKHGGEIIYVGKAVNLKTACGSIFMPPRIIRRKCRRW